MSRRSARRGIEVWPAVADMMTGTTLMMFVLGFASVIMMNWDADDLRVASDSYTDVRKKHPESNLPAKIGTYMKSQFEDWLQSRESALRERHELRTELEQVKASLEEYEKMGAVGARVARRIKEALDRHHIAATVAGGRILLQADVLFKSNESVVQSDVGEQIGDAILTVLADPKIAANVRYVLVQGHTDAAGSAESNRRLSTERARAMVQSWTAKHASKFRGLDDGEFGVSGASCIGAKVMYGGFGEARPRPTCQRLNCSENRRLEIEIVPKRANENDQPGCP